MPGLATKREVKAAVMGLSLEKTHKQTGFSRETTKTTTNHSFTVLLYFYNHDKPEGQQQNGFKGNNYYRQLYGSVVAALRPSKELLFTRNLKRKKLQKHHRTPGEPYEKQKKKIRSKNDPTEIQGLKRTNSLATWSLTWWFLLNFQLQAPLWQARRLISLSFWLFLAVFVFTIS